MVGGIRHDRPRCLSRGRETAVVGLGVFDCPLSHQGTGLFAVATRETGLSPFLLSSHIR